MTATASIPLATCPNQRPVSDDPLSVQSLPVSAPNTHAQERADLIAYLK